MVRLVLRAYVDDMIADGDRERLERELLQIISAERHLVLRARGIRR